MDILLQNLRKNHRPKKNISHDDQSYSLRRAKMAAILIYQIFFSFISYNLYTDDDENDSTTVIFGTSNRASYTML